MKMKFIKFSILGLLSTLFVSCGGNPSEADKAIVDFARANGFSIRANKVANADPAVLFCYSNHLWEEGQKDEAAFWYYVAQLRSRIIIYCSEEMRAGSFSEAEAKEILLLAGFYANRESLEKVHMIGGFYRPELYKLVMEFLGKTINEYLGGDQELWKSTIDRVVEYEDTNPFNPMGLVPPPVFKDDETVQKMLNGNKEGILELRQWIVDNADSIRVQRNRNGLENHE